MAKKKWSKPQIQRCQTILTVASQGVGGWQAMADALKVPTRATVFSWYSRGRVPLEHCQKVVALAAEHGMTCTAGELHPGAKALENTAK